MDRRPSSEALEHIALRWLHDGNEPGGARRLAEVFRAEGADLAEATAGRFLRGLDEAGLTRPVGVRGRVLTDKGQQRLEVLTERQSLNARTELVALSIAPDTIMGLVELLTARRAIEPEAARLAAINATDQELAAMTEAASQPLDCIDSGPSDRLNRAHGLHRLIGQASHNKIIAAIVTLLVDQRHDDLALALDDVVLSSGSMQAASHDHGELVAALVRRDPDAAEAAMRNHLSDLVALAERRLKTSPPPAGDAADPSYGA